MYKEIQELAQSSKDLVIEVVFPTLVFARVQLRFAAREIVGSKKFSPAVMTWNFENNSVIRFCSYGSVMETRGIHRDYLYVVCPERIDVKILSNLETRTRLKTKYIHEL